MDGNCGKVDGKLDLHATHEIRGSNPTKLHHTNKSQKQIGAIFVGNSRIRDKINKNKASNTTGRLRTHDQRGSRYQDDIGWNPNRPIFHERSGSRDEHEEHEGEKRENTRGNTRGNTKPT